MGLALKGFTLLRISSSCSANDLVAFKKAKTCLKHLEKMNYNRYRLRKMYRKVERWKFIQMIDEQDRT
jgi:hypothetical protein